MISHKHKCIFIHIPKCAGTSIEKALGHFDGFDGPRNGQDHRSLRVVNPCITAFDLLRSKENVLEYARRYVYSRRVHDNPNNELTVNKRQYADYYKFSFVRNPWARTYSWYKNVVRDATHLKNLKIDADISFGDFVERFLGRGMLRSQIYYLEDYKGQVNFDFIGRFENLQEDFSKVCQDIGLGDIGLPHAIKGDPSDNYRSHYDEHLVSMVAECYSREIELFDYKF